MVMVMVAQTWATTTLDSAADKLLVQQHVQAAANGYIQVHTSLTRYRYLLPILIPVTHSTFKQPAGYLTFPYLVPGGKTFFTTSLYMFHPNGHL